MPATAPILLLTRPEPQARRFLAQCEAAHGGPIDAVISPVLDIVPRETAPDLTPYAAVIVTSENAVPFLRPANGSDRQVFAVGDGTAEAVRRAGFPVNSASGDADDLVEMIARTAPYGRMIHLRGEHAIGEIAARLTAAGLPTDDHVVYEQRATPLTPAVQKLLSAPSRPVVLPLFSPRSARLIREQVPEIATEVIPLAMSPRVAGAWGQNAPLARSIDRPTARAMVGAILDEMPRDSAC